jgi:hypothetical protein
MTQYELLDAMNGIAVLNFEALAVFVTISSFAIAGAYVAGRKLDWVFSIGIAGLYSITTLGVIMARVQQIHKFEILDDALHSLIESEGPNAQLRNYLETTPISDIAYVIYGAIWMGVVFFIFYARVKFGADS